MTNAKWKIMVVDEQENNTHGSIGCDASDGRATKRRAWESRISLHLQSSNAAHAERTLLH